MPPTKSQKAAKVADNVDDNQGFVEKQRGIASKVKNRQDEARSRIRKDCDNKQKELQARIKALKRVALVQQSGNETDADAPSPDLTAFDALRDLLARKTVIEQRIAQNIESLEKAMQTTYREFQVVLASRTQLLTSTKAPADANAASTAIVLKL
ncbi:hypothetical protein E4T44_02942 [Aureobasidium sp. EXF-8845]|nr:hypothetical protein E4T44_02942 [Aureobasidium sp. EXF-8845]KAI4854952.1 hypothetical protein E4T45_03617 [Aureobasidium sp. EXF-8846]